MLFRCISTWIPPTIGPLSCRVIYCEPPFVLPSKMSLTRPDLDTTTPLEAACFRSLRSLTHFLKWTQSAPQETSRLPIPRFRYVYSTLSGVFGLTITRQGTVMAIYTLRCFLGCMSCIWVGDQLGRRMTIVTGAIINVLGSALQCTAFGVPQLAIGRLITGFDFGHIAATAPNLQAELCRAEHRGAAVLLEGVFISLGLSIAAWVDLAMFFCSGTISWRFPLALSIFWAAIVMSTAPFMPESPRWLVKKGRIQEARQVLAAVGDLDKDSAEMAADIQDMSESLAVASQGRFGDIWSNAPPLRLLHRTLLACVGQLFHQLSGVNALAFYQAKIFEERVGLGGLESRILAGVVFTFQFFVSPAVSHNTAAMSVAVTAIFMFSFLFPIGFLRIPFLYAAEMAPLSHRVPITSISTGTAWLVNSAIAEVTPMGFASLGYRYFIIYTVMNFFSHLASGVLFVS